MAKILSIDNMLDAAYDSKMPNFDLHLQLIEDAASMLAHALARHLKVVPGPGATWESGMGGLCADFYAKSARQKCPKVLEDGDPGGDWEE